MMKLSIGLLGDYPQSRNIDFSHIAERLGFAEVWCAEESPAPGYRDLFVTATAVGLNTSRIRIVVGNVNPFSRNIGVLAVAINSLALLSKGRVNVSLAMGGVNPLLPLGLTYQQPLQSLRDMIGILRRLFQGETVNYQGVLGKLNNLVLDPPPPLPIDIFVGARGPKLLALAGELADGVNISTSISTLPTHINYIQEGLNRSKRTLSDIQIIYSTTGVASIHEESEKARELIRPVLAWRLKQQATNSFMSSVFTVEHTRKVKLGQMSGQSQYLDKVQESHFNEFGIVGDPKEVTQKINHLSTLGVDRFTWGIFLNPQPEYTLTLLGEKVIPRLK